MTDYDSNLRFEVICPDVYRAETFSEDSPNTTDIRISWEKTEQCKLYELLGIWS